METSCASCKKYTENFQKFQNVSEKLNKLD